jgi:catechol 2,3-dioxygenase-like lactoylglutathione lyase family enzyme
MEEQHMQTHLAHIQFNVAAANIPFYKELMGFLGWNTLYENEGMVGVGDKHGTSVWFIGQVKEVSNDYDGPGMNHLAIGAVSQADVDTVANYLDKRGIVRLFETPRHRSEFSQGEGQTYYQVMFETPDRILLEVVYTGPKTD